MPVAPLAIALPLLAIALWLLIVPAAGATSGDLFARGVRYSALTHSSHGTYGPNWGASIDLNVGTMSQDLNWPLYAPEDGSVAIVERISSDGWGNAIVWTSADGREKLFIAHLAAFGHTGPVAAGDLIGRIGGTGSSTSSYVPHAHVERQYGGRAAALVLSGRTIVPGMDPGCTYYTSLGPLSDASSAPRPLWLAQDANGDGRDDQVAVCGRGTAGTTIWFFVSDGSGVTRIRAWRSTSFDASRCTFVAGDYNGDGRDDLAGACYAGDGRTRVCLWLSSGTALAFTRAWTSGSGGFDWERCRWLAGDVNADGRSEFIGVYRFSSSQARLFWWRFDRGVTTLVRAATVRGFDADRGVFLAGDFTGDGRDDLLSTHERKGAVGGVFRWISTGERYRKPVRVWTRAGRGLEAKDCRWLPGDANGDGAAELIAVAREGATRARIFWWSNSGSAMRRTIAATASGFDAARATFLTGDFNHDGRQDLAACGCGVQARVFRWLSAGGRYAAGTRVWRCADRSFDGGSCTWMAGDVNGDGSDELIAICTYRSGKSAIFWLFNTGSGMTATRVARSIGF